MRSPLRSWFHRTERFWSHLLGERTPSTFARRIGVEPLEDRVVPDGRPLPFPVTAAGSGIGATPIAKLFDGDTGEVLLTTTPFGSDHKGGVRVAVGDLTHDSYPDLVTAAGPGGGRHVRVFDGKTGLQLPGVIGSFFAFDPAFTGGVQVATGELTGDGWFDVVTAADEGGGPHVRVFDGKTGAEVKSFFAFESSFTGGVRLAVGELDGDYRPDLVVAAGTGGAPRVRVLSGKTFEQIAGPLGDFYAYDPAERGGVWMATGFVTGTPRTNLVAGSGQGRDPEVKVFDAVTGSVVRDFHPFESKYQSGVRVATA